MGETRKIRLAADYHCFPLWEASPGKIGNIDPQDLPVSQALRRRLIRWAEDFDATLDLVDPRRSGFTSQVEETAFAEAGQELAKQLQDELGPDHLVIMQTGS